MLVLKGSYTYTAKNPHQICWYVRMSCLPSTPSSFPSPQFWGTFLVSLPEGCTSHLTFSPPPRFPFKDKIYIYQNLPAFGVKFCEFWLIHTFVWLPPQSRYGMVPSSPQIPLDPFLAPSQFQPTDVSPVPTVLAFPGYPVNGIIQHIVFKTGFLRSIQHTWNSSTLLWVSAHHS